ncbi:hypothetical protein J1N35_007713, partial [Gossypium stocksii]
NNFIFHKTLRFDLLLTNITSKVWEYFALVVNIKRIMEPLSILIIWQKPKVDFVKINTNGSTLSNLGRDSTGTLIKDHNVKNSDHVNHLLQTLILGSKLFYPTSGNGC